jgi:hypothetical protein
MSAICTYVRILLVFVGIALIPWKLSEINIFLTSLHLAICRACLSFYFGSQYLCTYVHMARTMYICTYVHMIISTYMIICT